MGKIALSCAGYAVAMQFGPTGLMILIGLVGLAFYACVDRVCRRDERMAALDAGTWLGEADRRVRRISKKGGRRHDS